MVRYWLPPQIPQQTLLSASSQAARIVSSTCIKTAPPPTRVSLSSSSAPASPHQLVLLMVLFCKIAACVAGRRTTIRKTESRFNTPQFRPFAACLGGLNALGRALAGWVGRWTWGSLFKRQTPCFLGGARARVTYRALVRVAAWATPRSAAMTSVTWQFCFPGVFMLFQLIQPMRLGSAAEMVPVPGLYCPRTSPWCGPSRHLHP